MPSSSSASSSATGDSALKISSSRKRLARSQDSLKWTAPLSGVQGTAAAARGASRYRDGSSAPPPPSHSVAVVPSREERNGRERAPVPQDPVSGLEVWGLLPRTLPRHVRGAVPRGYTSQSGIGPISQNELYPAEHESVISFTSSYTCEVQKSKFHQQSAQFVPPFKGPSNLRLESNSLTYNQSND